MCKKEGLFVENIAKRRILCEDSIEGIFSAVYYIYEKKYEKQSIELKVEGNNQNYELFTIDEFVPVNLENAVKVAKTVQRRFGQEVYYALLRVALAGEKKDKAQAIFGTIQYGISNNVATDLLNHLKKKEIFQTFQINRTVINEANRYIDFIRFKELANGVLYSKIAPENDVLPLIAEHFTDRLRNENFVVYDENRKTALVYQQKTQWEIVRNIMVEEEQLQMSECEENIKNLWKIFYESIAIKERCNLELQKQLLPLKFRKFMTEFV